MIEGVEAAAAGREGEDEAAGMAEGAATAGLEAAAATASADAAAVDAAVALASLAAGAAPPIAGDSHGSGLVVTFGSSLSPSTSDRDSLR